MKYAVRIGEAEHDVVIEGETVSIDGESVVAHIAEVEGTPIRAATIGDAMHRVIVRRGSTRGAWTLWVGGHRFDVEALDERTRAIRELSKLSGAGSGPAPLVAPMPGLIVRVHVAVGDQVQAGQGLVVMEAMKMENELRASAAGTVRQIHATPGSAVEKGTLLIELE